LIILDFTSCIMATFYISMLVICI